MMTAASLLLATMLAWQNRSQSIALQSTTPDKSSESQGIALVRNEQPANSYAARDWSTKPALTSSYLGVRYVAVMAGVGALPDDIQPAADAHALPSKSKPPEPATVRNLMNELLPAPADSDPTRS
jgi:hypothetical protein